MSKFIDDLKSNVYCRLAASPIHGVGVFAIRDIPHGVDPMLEQRDCELEEIKSEDIENDPDISSAVKKLVRDMCPEVDGTFYVPNCSLNEIGISFYMNHSATPNMREEDGFFYATRPIKSGEELTVDYGTYGNLNL